MEKKHKWKLVNPEGLVLTDLSKVNPHPSEMNGKTVLLYWNGKPNGDVFLNRLAELFHQKAPGIKIIKAWEANPTTNHTDSNYIASRAVAAKLAEHKPDIVIGAPGDCSGSTTWLIIDQLNLERMGIPTITVVTSAFTTLADTIPNSEGFQKPCFIQVPHPIGMLSREETNVKTDKAFDDIFKAITSWQAPEYVKPSGNPYPAEVFEFEGNIEDCNREFFARKWSLGIPLIPPTPERVNAMLSGTNRKPSDVLGQVPPRMGTLTVELVAVHAVMAGCLPQYMPVLIAMLEAFMTRETNWRMALTSTGASQMIAIVNGPIVKELNMGYQQGAAGKGYHANGSIGYAMNLIAYSVGGSRPPSMDRSTLASPADYVCWVFGENEDAIPPGWQPLHVDRGFKKSDSVVTVMCSYPPIANMDHWSSTPEEHARWWGRNISPVQNMGGPCFPEAMESNPIVALGPEHAALVAKAGWNKDKFKIALWESTAIPISTWPPSCAPDILIQKFGKVDSNSSIPIVLKPEQFVITVAGGDGKQSHYFPPLPVALPVSRLITK